MRYITFKSLAVLAIASVICMVLSRNDPVLLKVSIIAFTFIIVFAFNVALFKDSGRDEDSFYSNAELRQFAFENSQALVYRATDLLSEAQRNVIIYDTGDVSSSSLWNNEQFITTMRRKLEESPTFKAAYFFDRNATNHFVETFKVNARVNIFQQKDNLKKSLESREQWRQDGAYLTIDGGRKTLFLQNRYFTIDCSRIPEHDRNAINHAVHNPVQQKEYKKL